MGSQNRLPEMLAAEDERCFPKLAATGYQVKSPKDPKYNCIAFAAGDTSRKWDCPLYPIPGYYWPANARRGDDVESLKSAFEQVGYAECEHAEPVEGFEKVALYADKSGFWTHAAKQEPDGSWLCKLGDEEDIRHNRADCFAGSIYGDVALFMQRPIAEKINEGIDDLR